MGTRFRKSVKLGPFRINFSKSGVGWSVGNKYARYTRKANGGTRVTTTLPGTGISHVEELGRSRSSTRKPSTVPVQASAPQEQEAPRWKEPTPEQSRRRTVVAVIVGAVVVAAILIYTALSISGFHRTKDYSDNWRDAPSRQVVISSSDG